MTKRKYGRYRRYDLGDLNWREPGQDSMGRLPVAVTVRLLASHRHGQPAGHFQPPASQRGLAPDDGFEYWPERAADGYCCGAGRTGRAVAPSASSASDTKTLASRSSLFARRRDTARARPQPAGARVQATSAKYAAHPLSAGSALVSSSQTFRGRLLDAGVPGSAFAATTAAAARSTATWAATIPASG